MSRTESTGEILYSMNCTPGERRLVGFALGAIDPDGILIQETEKPVNNPELPLNLTEGRTIITLDCVDDKVLSEFQEALKDLRSRYRRIG